MLGNSVVKAAALAATAAARTAGNAMAQGGDQPVAGATEAGPQTSPEVAAAQKKLKALQWAIPGLTGTLIGLAAQQEEQDAAESGHRRRTASPAVSLTG